jgi:hypothetical protein
MRTQSQDSPSLVAGGLNTDLLFPVAQLFPLGFSSRIWCRMTNVRRDSSGALLCTLHAANGAVEARVSRPDIDLHSFEDWQVVHADMVTTTVGRRTVAEIMRLQAFTQPACSYLDLMPRAICASPRKLDELLALAQCVTTPQLRLVLESVFSVPSIFLPFLTCFAGSDAYAYPSGLLVRTVEAAKQAFLMEYETEEEADMVLTAALLYDIGRILDRTLASDVISRAIGFIPNRNTRRLVAFALNPARCHLHLSLEEVLSTGFCERYPSLRGNLKQGALLQDISAALI